MRIVAFVGASILLAVLPAILARPASGGTVRLTCRDGDPDVVVSPRGLGGPAFCNHDLPGDGACTFAICSLCPLLRGCVGPESGVCPEGEPPPPEAKVITVKVGVSQEKGKQIQKLIKDAKLKVNASIQGDAVRVSGAKKDDLQDAISLTKKSITDFPLQYQNFRD